MKHGRGVITAPESVWITCNPPRTHSLATNCGDRFPTVYRVPVAHLQPPGERANAELKSWKVLRKIRFSPSRGTVLVQAAQTLMIIG